MNVSNYQLPKQLFNNNELRIGTLKYNIYVLFLKLPRNTLMKIREFWIQERSLLSGDEAAPPPSRAIILRRSFLL